METNLETGKRLSFNEMVKHGIDNGGNIVNGMPWSWAINGSVISHENDDRYIIETPYGYKKMNKGDTLLVLGNGLHVLKSLDTHATGSCPL